MADSVVHIGENSPEQVAYKLLEMVASVERKKLFGGDPASADRAWILSTYADCIGTVRRAAYDPPERSR